MYLDIKLHHYTLQKIFFKQSFHENKWFKSCIWDNAHAQSIERAMCMVIPLYGISLCFLRALGQVTRIQGTIPHCSTRAVTPLKKNEMWWFNFPPDIDRQWIQNCGLAKNWTHTRSSTYVPGSVAYQKYHMFQSLHDLPEVPHVPDTACPTRSTTCSRHCVTYQRYHMFQMLCDLPEVPHVPDAVWPTRSTTCSRCCMPYQKYHMFQMLCDLPEVPHVPDCVSDLPEVPHVPDAVWPTRGRYHMFQTLRKWPTRSTTCSRRSTWGTGRSCCNVPGNSIWCRSIPEPWNTCGQGGGSLDTTEGGGGDRTHRPLTRPIMAASRKRTCNRLWNWTNDRLNAVTGDLAVLAGFSMD